MVQIHYFIIFVEIAINDVVMRYNFRKRMSILLSSLNSSVFAFAATIKSRYEKKLQSSLHLILIFTRSQSFFLQFPLQLLNYCNSISIQIITSTTLNFLDHSISSSILCILYFSLVSYFHSCLLFNHLFFFCFVSCRNRSDLPRWNYSVS